MYDDSTIIPEWTDYAEPVPGYGPTPAPSGYDEGPPPRPPILPPEIEPPHVVTTLPTGTHPEAPGTSQLLYLGAAVLALVVLFGGRRKGS